MLPITPIVLTFLSCRVLHTSAAPTGHSRRNIIAPKGRSFLVAAISICLLLALLLLAKCIFLARRRKPLHRYEPWVFQQKTPSLKDLKSEESLSHSSPPSFVRWSEWLNTTVANIKDSKSAFFIGLFGSPSWETRYSNTIPDGAFAQPGDSCHFSASSLDEICSPMFRSLTLKTRNKSRQQRLLTRSFVSRYHNRARKFGISHIDLTGRPSSQLVRSSRNISAKRGGYLSRDSAEFGLSPTRMNEEKLCSEGVYTGGSPSRRPRSLIPDSKYYHHLGTEINVPEPAYMPHDGDRRSILAMHDALGIKQGSKDCDAPENSECRETTVNESTTYFKATGEAFTHSNQVLELEGPHIGPVETDAGSIQDINPFDVDLKPTHIEAHNDSEYPEQQSFISLSLSDEGITPILPLNPIKYRTKIRSPNIDRVIRSPKHGPSPLRNVLIPTDEQISPHITGHTLDICLDEQPVPPSSSSFSIDLLEVDSINLRGKKTSRRDGSPSQLADNCLINFLEELIAETSAWDESLFVDDNFKAMVALNTAPKPLKEKPTCDDADSGQRQELHKFQDYEQNTSFWDEEEFQDSSCIIGLAC